MIRRDFYVTCDFCGDPAGNVGMPNPSPILCLTVEEAITDAIEREWAYNHETRRLLCPTCAECECGNAVPYDDPIEQGWVYNRETQRLVCPTCVECDCGEQPRAQLVAHPGDRVRGVVGGWSFLEFFDAGAGYASFARRDCPACRGQGLVPAPTWNGNSGDTDNCVCVRSVPRPMSTAAGLLTDQNGQVLHALIYAPADVETWMPDLPVVVTDPASGGQVAALAGQIALYESPIGHLFTQPRAAANSTDTDSGRVACAYCDAPMVQSGGFDLRYVSADPERPVCPAHPRIDRPRPHLAKRFTGAVPSPRPALTSEVASPPDTRRERPLPAGVVERLRLAAAGRRAYAANSPAGHPHRGELLDEAAVYDTAALIAADPGALELVIPSWLPTDAGRIDPAAIAVTFSPTAASVGSEGESWFVAAYTAWQDAAERRGVQITWSSYDYSLLDVDEDEDNTIAAVQVGANWYVLRHRGGIVGLVSVPAPTTSE
jgi:hypothetical protein